ncbi:MAG: serine/threonine-protein phosphatase [Actinobacteria bacterium]|nr:serine/threonine-protein phosphatase [Actinomycetota bacterium]
MTFVWAAATDAGRVRRHNEDALWPRPEDASGRAAGEAEETLLAAVADGMGGHVGGEVASRLAIEAAVTADGEAAARVHAANAAVVGTALDRPRLAGMGTTMTLALFTPGAVEIGHIGDSRAYLRRDGVLTQLTRDHSLMAEMIASGELTPDQAAVHPFRSVITRAIGMESRITVDSLQRDLEPGDRVLLCTDGLTTMLPDVAVADLLAAGDPAAAAADLIDAANRAGGVDNISVVVIDWAR